VGLSLAETIFGLLRSMGRTSVRSSLADVSAPVQKLCDRIAAGEPSIKHRQSTPCEARTRRAETASTNSFTNPACQQRSARRWLRTPPHDVDEPGELLVAEPLPAGECDVRLRFRGF